MRNRVFGAFVLIVLGLGITCGYRLSEIANLETLKLLNVTGLLYNLLGIVVLSVFIPAPRSQETPNRDM